MAPLHKETREIMVPSLVIRMITIVKIEEDWSNPDEPLNAPPRAFGICTQPQAPVGTIKPGKRHNLDERACGYPPRCLNQYLARTPLKWIDVLEVCSKAKPIGSPEPRI